MECFHGSETYTSGVEPADLSFAEFNTYEDVTHQSEEDSPTEDIVDQDADTIVVSPSKDLLALGSGSSLIRILRVTRNVQLSPKSGCYVETNYCIKNLRESGWMWVSYLRIARLQRHWLNSESYHMIVVKAGVIHPNHSGRVGVYIFNKTDNQLTITKKTAIAQLESCLYEYSTPAGWY